jgi:hypothetical protein
VPMTPPILTNEGVSNYLRVLEGKVGLPDHRNMAIFELADKFTLTRTFILTSRLAACQTGNFLFIYFHASRRLVSEEESEAMKRWEDTQNAFKPYIRPIS